MCHPVRSERPGRVALRSTVREIIVSEHPELSPSAARKSLGELIGQYWSWLFLLIIIVAIAALDRSGGFVSLFNFQSLGANMAIVLIMALGQTFVIISGGIDLSSGFVMGLAAVSAATVMTALGNTFPIGINFGVALLVSVIVSLIPGFINGFFIARLGVPPFIVTLGMLGIARGVGFLISGGQPVSVNVKDMGQIGNGFLAYFSPSRNLWTFLTQPVGLRGPEVRELVRILPFPLIYIIALLFICAFLLAKTRFGQHTYAIGGNKEAASRAGIRVQAHLIKVYMFSAFMSALAGVLYTVRFTSGAANAGDPLLLDSIAAVVIGGASLFGGAGTIIGTLIGALIIAIIQNGLVILAINPFWQFVAVGIVIILAVLVDQAKAKVVQ